MNEKIYNFYMGITLIDVFLQDNFIHPQFFKTRRLQNPNCVHIMLGNQQVNLQKNVCLLVTYAHKVKYSYKGKINFKSKSNFLDQIKPINICLVYQLYV